MDFPATSLESRCEEKPELFRPVHGSGMAVVLLNKSGAHEMELRLLDRTHNLE